MNHLTDAQILSCLAAAEDADTRAHLSACDVCRKQIAGILKLSADVKSSVAAVSDKPAAFWTRQRASVTSRLTQGSPRVWRFATVIALVVVIAALLFQLDRPVPQKSPVVSAAAISDEALLATVSSTLQQQVPDALEPAQSLVDERQLAESNNSNSSAVTRR